VESGEKRGTKASHNQEAWDEETRRLAFSPVREFASIGRRNMAIRRLLRDINAGLSGSAEKEV